MKIEKDRIQHFGVCLIATLVMSCAAWFTSGSLQTGCAVGIALSAGLALGKEYGDKNATGNHWCWWDLLADFCGILAGLMLLILANVLLEWLLK